MRRFESGLLHGTWIAGMLAVAVLSGTMAAATERQDPWPELVRDIFPGRALADGAGILSIDMPARAEDAAIVPVTLRTTLPPGEARAVRAVTLVIDNNPAPVAATFKLGPNAGVTEISTRVRVDSYTNVHAVAELSDGSLHMVQTFVKASGGCSAPAAKNLEEAKASLGQMRLRQFAAKASSSLREAQIMVRHPNNSGLQMDQLTRFYVPLFIVREIKVWQGEELVFAMEGGISLSEDPNIRFTYRPNGAASFRVEATDTEGHVFRREWQTATAM